MNNKIKKKLLAALGCTTMAMNVAAAEFYFGEDDDITLSISSQLSIGASWRLDEADPRFIFSLNGGAGNTGTTDDGNLNFENGQTFSKIIKGVHDIQLSKDDWGFFTRLKYWYDVELADEGRPHGHSPNNYTSGIPLNDDNFPDLAKFSGIEFMDAYYFASFDIGDVPVDFRLGRQVVSWGESTFIQGGLSSTSPIDVNALRRPGASLKEGLLPVGMVYFNAGVTENLSIEAFYQYEFEPTQIDGCGTYFSGADFAAGGCYAITVSLPDQAAIAQGYYAHRSDDLMPDDGGQYGVAARYYAEDIDTEFGLYYFNIHSRFPLFNGIRTQTLAIPNFTSVFLPESLDPTGGLISALNPSYRIVFPEDLEFFGASFSTNIGGIALSGEVSYKPDTPIQINGPELLNSVLSEQPFFRFSPRLLAADLGADVAGYDMFDVTQIQVTALSFVEQVLGASRLSIIAELGYIMTDGIEDSNQLYGRNSVFGMGDFDVGGGINCTNLVAAGAIAGDCSSEGYVTDTAFGYRLRFALDYPNVISGVSLKPVIDWTHDVSGNSPDPVQMFHEGRKSFGISLEALYQQTYSLTLGYRAYSGGSHNVLEDKDFVSLSFGVSY